MLNVLDDILSIYVSLFFIANELKHETHWTFCIKNCLAMFLKTWLDYCNCDKITQYKKRMSSHQIKTFFLTTYLNSQRLILSSDKLIPISMSYHQMGLLLRINTLIKTFGLRFGLVPTDRLMTYYNRLKNFITLVI